MKYKHCIFDMDGTLVDSMGYWRGLERDYLAQKGVCGPIDDILELAKPLPLVESTALFIKSFHLNGTPEQMAAEMMSIMKQHYLDDITLKPGAHLFLEHLKQQNAKMCVVTATPKPLAEVCLSHLNLTHYFEFLLSCDEVGAGKDQPVAFLEAARRLNAVPADIAVFEDSLQAAQTAKKAGFYTVGLYDKYGAAYWDQLTRLADDSIRDWRLQDCFASCFILH